MRIFILSFWAVSYSNSNKNYNISLILGMIRCRWMNLINAMLSGAFLFSPLEPDSISFVDRDSARREFVIKNLDCVLAVRPHHLDHAHVLLGHIARRLRFKVVNARLVELSLVLTCCGRSNKS